MGAYGLADWAAVEGASDWPILLAGNGGSRAVSSSFAYPSLFDVANLTITDRAVFDELQTKNFEEVLRTLQLAAFVARQVGHDPTPIAARYEAVRHALIETVNDHHVAWDDVQGARLNHIKGALRTFEVVFTTSYDLVFYWAINHGGAHDEFVDHFWHNPDYHFDATNSPIGPGKTAVYWLHGALQIYRWDIDGTAKRLNNGAALLAQFADGGLLPLYVAEGSHAQKRRAIGSSDYLSFCYDTLRTEGRDLVIFGQQLGPTDQHLVEVIAANPARQIAYAVHPSSQHDVDVIKATVAQRLNRAGVHFFDSTTHPLGDAALFVG